MREIIAIVKKEIVRFISDKRLALSIFMPGLIIYVMYSVIGTAYSSKLSEPEAYTVSVVNLPQEIGKMYGDQIDFKEKDSGDIDAEKEKVEAEVIDALVIFSEDFYVGAELEDIEKMSENNSVEIYYKSSNAKSYYAYSIIDSGLENLEAQIVDAIPVNSDVGVNYDLSSEEDSMIEMFSMLMPMIMIMFVFNGCSGFATESIAGEKERGTLATVLATPIRRSNFAIGKVLGLSVIGLLGGISSFLGIMLSMPKMIEGMRISDNSIKIYGVADYVQLLIVIVSLVLVIVSLLTIVSSMAKSVKEATTYTVPFMVITSIIGASSIITDGVETSLVGYVIPFYNSVQCMNGIFLCQFKASYLIITVISNLIYTMMGVVILSKLFGSERIING